MPASPYLSNQLRAHVLRTATFAKPTVIGISLHTADPGSTGANEVSGGAYARATLNPLDANWAGAIDGRSSNLVVVTFPAPTGADWGTATHFGIWDAGAGGNFYIGAPLTPVVPIHNGDPAPSFAVGVLVVVFNH